LPVGVLLAAAWQGQDPLRIDLTRVYAGMSPEHWLGCDGLGRDVLARLAAGLRVSLLVGAGVVLSGLLIGSCVGMCAGLLGGWVDALLMRLVDVVLAFPGILLAIALAAMLGPGIGNLMLALTAVGWVGFARLARGQVCSLRDAPFVQAATAAGVSRSAIAWRHLLPNIAAPLGVEASLGFAAVVIGEAGLSFLGVGVQPPDASLGSMIREGTRVMLVQPWLVIWPGSVLFSLSVAVNLLGDTLRDHLDVRTVQGRE